MSRQREREEFVAAMTLEGVPVEVARQLMRAAATLHRIAELECSNEAGELEPWLRLWEAGMIHLPYPWCRGNPHVVDCLQAGYCRRTPSCGD